MRISDHVDIMDENDKIYLIGRRVEVRVDSRWVHFPRLEIALLAKLIPCPSLGKDPTGRQGAVRKVACFMYVSSTHSALSMFSKNVSLLIFTEP